MINHDIGMEDSLQKITLTREKDTSIMERFAQITDDVTTLKTLNLCTQFLDVTTISDITTTDGKSIFQWAWEVSQSDRWTRKTCSRHITSKNQLNWKKWRHYLPLLGANLNSKKWSSPLGKWLHLPSPRWKHLYSILEDVVLSKHVAVYVSYSRTGRRSSTRSLAGKFSNPTIWRNPIPSDLARANF